MYIAVTGGTGFVGSHTVRALRDAGHRVRLLVRSPDRVGPALEPLGIAGDEVEHVVADVLDVDAIRRGLEGVDAVLHAASVYSYDPRRATELARTNDEGARTVLGSAVALGLDPIVHVSSVVALARSGTQDETMTADSPVGDSPMPYPASKARQEAYARGLQDAGAPVVIVHPGAVWGPHDPHDGESVGFARAIVAGRFRLMPDIRVPVVDVRDVATVHAAVMEPGKGPRRFMAGGRGVPGDELVALVSQAHGRSQTTLRVPQGLARAAGHLGSALRGRGIDLGATAEGVWVGARRMTFDNTATEQELGMTFRPTADTLADQVAWMVETDRF